MSEPLEKEVQLHERNAQGQDVLIYPLPPGGYPLAVSKGGTGADSAAEACESLGAVKKSGDTMTGNLSITGYLYPSVYLMPTYNGVACRGVIEGSYVGAASFSVFEDANGSNRRMIEVRSASYAPSMDNAALLRTAVNGTYYAHRIFHTGMETPVPVGNGGTGASDAAGARGNLGITPGNIGAAASSHTHALTGSDITGTLPVSKGGTGAADAATARTNLGAAASGHTHALTDSAITGTLPLSKGGTGQTSAAAVRNALGLGNTTGALPVANGGTGASSAKAALQNLGIFYADTLPADGTDGQICLVPVG